MTLPLEVHPDRTAAVRRVAELIAERLRAGASTIAFSRGAELLEHVAAEDVPWSETSVYQVDERVAPSGHEDRNLTQLHASLPRPRCTRCRSTRPTSTLLRRATPASLPAALDLVHLGLGPDGHTASLLPGDPVLDVSDRLVAVTQQYQGYRRMTLTYPALEAARELVWLVTGVEKREALARLLDRDTSIPAARIASSSQLIVCDQAAATR